MSDAGESHPTPCSSLIPTLVRPGSQMISSRRFQSQLRLGLRGLGLRRNDESMKGFRASVGVSPWGCEMNMFYEYLDFLRNSQIQDFETRIGFSSCRLEDKTKDN